MNLFATFTAIKEILLDVVKNGEQRATGAVLNKLASCASDTGRDGSTWTREISMQSRERTVSKIPLERPMVERVKRAWKTAVKAIALKQGATSKLRSSSSSPASL